MFKPIVTLYVIANLLLHDTDKGQLIVFKKIKFNKSAYKTGRIATNIRQGGQLIYIF